MKIADSQVSMGSRRQYYEMGNRSSGKKGNQSFRGIVSEMEASEMEYRNGNQNLYTKNGTYAGEGNQNLYNSSGTFEDEGAGIEGNILLGTPIYPEFLGSMKTVGTEVAGGTTHGGMPTKLQFSMLNVLMRRLFNARFSSNGGMMGMQRTVNYEEYEDTTFYAKGRAITEDGRQIDFNVDLVMSRSYMEYTDTPVMQLGNALCDPLIINVGSTISQISDQKFKFDLDADGVMDEISMLGEGSGFLALDLNEDGIINDGSELFGTKSGNGFEDLKAYDSDGNGWIDENDAIFSKLKVWCKNEAGEDILMDLKQADIGAIFLGSQNSEFSMYGMNGGLNGMVRSTGFFLKESGGAGTVQHIDLATKAVEDPVRADFMARQQAAEEEIDGSLGDSYLTGGNLTDSSKDEKDTSFQTQEQDRIAARRREEREYRNRMSRNRKLREERLAKQRLRRQEETKLEEERTLKRREKRKEYKEEQIAKLLEDRTEDLLADFRVFIGA